MFQIIYHCHGYAQNYGLGFFSHEVQQDKRTSIDLSPGRDLCLSDNFSLSFELSFEPGRAVYFGYVVRIIENGRRNYDLVYNTAKDQFNIIAGDSLCGINFTISRTKLYNQWNKIVISFNGENGVSVSNDGKKYTQRTLHPGKNSCYKILFGANQSEQFSTTDIPPMKIRNIEIFKKGVPEYHWPLEEVEGTTALDILKGAKAVAKNPSWKTALHAKWQKGSPVTVNGMASVCFDRERELLYLVAEDTLYTYAANDVIWKKAVTKNKINLNQGSRSVFNPVDGRLYSYFQGKDTAAVVKFDEVAGRWKGNFEPGDVTGYWHANSMFSAADTSLYLFGGYGYLRYKNSINRYHFNTGKWSSIKAKGDFFTPRYLAGAGATPLGDTAYILGGYGNSSGQQIINPGNLYDMMRFTVRDRTFKKLYELKINREDFALANSLIIDGQNYYGLIYPRHKYNSSLQLISGSLKSPSFQALGSQIPFLFHDVHSFADLYYCKKSKKFVAVTLLRTEDNRTIVNVFTLLGPPYVAPVQKVAEHKLNSWYYLAAIAGLISVAALFLLLRIRNKKAGRGQEASLTEPAGAAIDEVGEAVTGAQQSKPVQTSNYDPPAVKNAILLFGDMQVFDASGCNITKLFTPLMKELFLLILLHSVKLGRGVSSDKLNEMFWFDKTEKSARNNRSVAIVKLKSLLEKLEYCTLSKDSGYWMIDIDHRHFYVDYHSYLNMINNRKKMNDADIIHLSGIVQRGNFLSNSEYEWLDKFKSDIANDIINTYQYYLQMPAHNSDPEFLINIANRILHIDPVNEEALSLKCCSFVALGKHSLAKSTFEDFLKAYKHMYDRTFDKDFHSVLENSSHLKKY
ncbi:galactose oxidase [Mucilaginibacter pedocola]|uniref:galactose oxidase n=1 Tax=Mucilaginibacter pedocola TaxID=1792845 RepID=UPI00138FBBE5|nr:galactose oxidase [Mucilaginibacter pedocola]